MILPLSISILTLLCAPLQKSGELLANPGFSKGSSDLILKGAELSGHVGPKGKGQTVVLFGAGSPGTWTNVGFRVKNPPLEKNLNFSAQLFTEHKSQVLLVNAFAYGENRKKLDSWLHKFSMKANKWKPVKLSYELPEGVELLEIWVINQNNREAYVAEPSLLGGPPVPEALVNLSGPGILLASASVAVRKGKNGDAGVVTFPIPLITEHQIPLSFDLIVEPKEALLGFQWELRPDGVNWLCKASIDPSAQGAKVRWESLVLVGERKDRKLPAAKAPEVPEEAAAWMASTACIQSADEDIIAKANELGAGKKSVGTYVKNVLKFTSTNQGVDGASFLTLDASAALECGGSCTSRANLAAALLRAGGIPARTSAHLPTWSGPLYEHWHVEYWHPGAGWTWVEPTMGKLRPQPISMVVLNVANPEDEEEGFSPVIGHSGVMLGVPRYSVHEFSDSLDRWVLPMVDSNLNYARPLAHLDSSKGAQTKLFKDARLAWEALKEENLSGRANLERRSLLEACMTPPLIEKKKVTKSLSEYFKRK